MDNNNLLPDPFFKRTDTKLFMNFGYHGLENQCSRYYYDINRFITNNFV